MFLPACVALLVVLVITTQAVYADHGEAEVSLVPPGAGPDANYSDNPLVLPNLGDTGNIDFLVVLSEQTDNIFGAELHFAIEPLGIVAVVDADPLTPGDQLRIDGDLLALTGNLRTISVFRGHGGRHFGPEERYLVGPGWTSFELADFDEDGDLDLATVNPNVNAITLVPNLSSSE